MEAEANASSIACRHRQREEGGSESQGLEAWDTNSAFWTSHIMLKDVGGVVVPLAPSSHSAGLVAR